LAPDDPKAHDRRNWKGTNWLGEEIEKVRKELDKDGYFDKLNE
jgi:hypothetical protein